MAFKTPISIAQAHMGMFVWTIIVGFSFPAVGWMSEGLPPMLLTAIRFLIAALVIWPMLPKNQPQRLGYGTLLLYGIMGSALALYFGIMFWAAHRVTSLTMATLYVSVPVLAYAMGRQLGVEPQAKALMKILLLGALGALALAWAESGGQLQQIQLGPSEAIFFLGCIASALYPVLSKWGLNRGLLAPSALYRTFWSLLIGSVIIGVMGLLWEPPQALGRMHLLDLGLLLYLSLFSSGLTYWLLQQATSVLTPAAVTAYSYLLPFVSMLLLLTHSPDLRGWHWLPGSTLVVMAITLLMYRDIRQRQLIKGG
ncbi:EamA family transporter [Magnetococcus sp. PR-3]|uniref:EamA family transporter n=1 Tax=Magnetococcus sp. PR-3 TaxID=3120355 RepID=UPI002FCE00C0